VGLRKEIVGQDVHFVEHEVKHHLEMLIFLIQQYRDDRDDRYENKLNKVISTN